MTFHIIEDFKWFKDCLSNLVFYDDSKLTFSEEREVNSVDYFAVADDVIEIQGEVEHEVSIVCILNNKEI